jgi:ribosomal protein S18 acetylase RimI-like enzyme
LPIDCLARTPDAARIAQDALSSCGFGGGVRLVSAEEVKQHLEEYDLVVVAVVVKPKRSVLKLLRKRCRHGCQVLCRTSDGLRQMLYEPVVPDRDLRGFHRKGLQSGGHTPRISVWLLEAAASAAAQVRLEWLKSVDSSMATQLLRLLNRTLEEETSIGFPGPIDEETGRNLMRQLNQDVAAGHRHVLVAYMDNTIVGQVILSPNSSPNHRHIVELTRGTIDPSFRGGGLALRAFQEVARKCDELRREVICLDVRAGTYAAVWWQYFGFKQYGLLQDYSRVGENRYRGLYLTQTTEELKQRLLELTTGAAVLDAQKQFPIA